jgi:acyl-CoA thioesterase-2
VVLHQTRTPGARNIVTCDLGRSAGTETTVPGVEGTFAEIVDLGVKRKDLFTGPASSGSGSRTFGGQFLAQSLTAAQRTVTQDRVAHSMHSYFLKGGQANTSVELEVIRLRDGRSFSQRQVVVSQQGAELFRTLISFQVPEAGLEWHKHAAIPVATPTNEQPYTDYSDYVESVLPPNERPWPGRSRPIKVRYVDSPPAVGDGPITSPQLMWMQINSDLGTKQELHTAGLAYLTDIGMDSVIALPHGYRWRDEEVTTASLNHSIWFHRPAEMNEWLLYEQRVEWTNRGRGLANGRFYDPAGQLIATCMQEGLLRWNSEAKMSSGDLVSGGNPESPGSG